MPTAKILVIEDEEALLDMYLLRFEKEGYKVSGARNGREGLALAKTEQPDLVFLDVVMPEMDGYEVLRKIKSDSATEKLRVVFLSNLGQQEEIAEGLAAGAEDYLIKANLTPSALVLKAQEKLGGAAVLKQKNKKEKVAVKISPKVGKSCAGVRVLLIEDNEAIIDMYQLRLEAEGAKVTVAKNGAWGLRQAQSGEYDIILLDMVMPASHGLDAIKSLKQNAKTAAIPIIVFSNSAQDEDMELAKKLGAENYFIKSNITPATIIREIINLKDSSQIKTKKK